MEIETKQPEREQLELNQQELNQEPSIPEANSNINIVRPEHPLVLKFANDIFTIELSGYSEQALFDLFNATLGHQQVKKSNDLLVKIAPKRLELLKKGVDKEEKKVSYTG